MHVLEFDPFDVVSFRQAWLFFARRLRVKQVVIFNSRIHSIADYLEHSGREGYSLLGGTGWNGMCLPWKRRYS